MRNPSWKMVASVAATASAVLLGSLWASGGQDDPKKDAPRANAVANAPATKPTGPTDAEARDLFRRAADVATASGLGEYGPGSLGKIAAARAEAGDHDEAGATLAAIEALTKALPEHDNILKNVHLKIAEGRALSGDLAGAIDTAARIEPASARAWALGGAADGYRRWKRPDLLR